MAYYPPEPPIAPIPQPPHTAGQSFQGFRSLIEPSQIPSPIAAANADQAIWDNEFYMTCSSQRSMPLSRSDYVAIDQGNSSPRFLRSTLYAVPHAYDLAATCQIPIAAILQPFADRNSQELPVPLVDFGDGGPPRCTKCRVYINPWCLWTASGQRWVCNLCGTENEVSPEYFSSLGMSGQRQDQAKRPELNQGTMDFAVPKEYWASQPPPRLIPLYQATEDSLSAKKNSAADASATARQPEPLRVLFAIDVSSNAVSSGMLQIVCDGLREIIYGSETDDTSPRLLQFSRVGIITFDQAIHFYNLSPGQAQASMLVVPDIDDIFLPLREGLFVDPSESRAVIEKLLESLPRLFADVALPHVSLGAALSAGLAAMSHFGGQIVAFQSSLPNYGPGALQSRNETELWGTDKEKTLYQPQDISWKELGEECAEAGVGVNLFVCPNQYVDVASIGIATAISGGELFLHPRFEPQRDGPVMVSELRRLLTRETVYNCSLRVRCSSGLRISSYEGNFYQRNSTDIELGNLDADKAIAIVLEHVSDLDERKDVYIQSVVLYTTASGQRRVRTHNLALAVSSLAGNVFKFGDIEATVCLLAKEAVSHVGKQPVRQIRDTFTERCSNLLLAYRRNCAVANATTQLILPEGFKLLPLYLLGLFKSKALKSVNISSDIRAAHVYQLLSRGVASTISYIYPRLIAFHDLEDAAGFDSPHTGRFLMPAPLPSSYIWMEAHGAYLIDNGDITVLWLGFGVSPQILLDLFGVEDWDSLGPRTTRLPELATHLSTQLRNIISVLESKRGGRTAPFYIARQNQDAAEIEFGNMLVEDRNNDAMSYLDYICFVHKQIGNAINNNYSSVSGSFWQTPW